MDRNRVIIIILLVIIIILIVFLIITNLPILSTTHSEVWTKSTTRR